MSGFAWVTLATNDSYSLGALVLAHSLRRVGTAHDLAVLITPGVTEVMREKLASVFTCVQEVNVLDSKDESNLALLARPELGITFTKLHCWRLTQYEKCVFVDADALVLRNCDELFEREELSAAPDVGWPDCFNSGVFVFKPSQQTFASITAFAAAKGSFDGGDQGLLNSYFSDWAHKDISKHLPFIYNMCSTATYSYLPAYKQFGENVRIIHFIGSTKPWLQYFDTQTGIVQPPQNCSHLQPLLQMWWNIFCENVHPQLSPVMASSTLATIWHKFTPVSHTSTFSSYPVYHGTNNRTVTYGDSYRHSPNSVHYENETKVPDFKEFQDPWENYNSGGNNDGHHHQHNHHQHHHHHHHHQHRHPHPPPEQEHVRDNPSAQHFHQPSAEYHHHDHQHHQCDYQESPDQCHREEHYNQPEWQQMQQEQQPCLHHQHSEHRETEQNRHHHEGSYTRDHEHEQQQHQHQHHAQYHHHHDDEHVESQDHQHDAQYHHHHNDEHHIQHVESQEHQHQEEDHRHCYHDKHDEHSHKNNHYVEYEPFQNSVHDSHRNDDRCINGNANDNNNDCQEKHWHNEQNDQANYHIGEYNKETDVQRRKSQFLTLPCTDPQKVATQSEQNIAGRLENGDAGLAGALAQMTLGEPKSPGQVALEEHMRKQSWEQGQIDYMGRDSFENIWKKICSTLKITQEPSPLQEEQKPEDSEVKASAPIASTELAAVAKEVPAEDQPAGSAVLPAKPVSTQERSMQVLKEISNEPTPKLLATEPSEFVSGSVVCEQLSPKISPVQIPEKTSEKLTSESTKEPSKEKIAELPVPSTPVAEVPLQSEGQGTEAITVSPQSLEKPAPPIGEAEEVVSPPAVAEKSKKVPAAEAAPVLPKPATIAAASSVIDKDPDQALPSQSALVEETPTKETNMTPEAAVPASVETTAVTRDSAPAAVPEVPTIPHPLSPAVAPEIPKPDIAIPKVPAVPEPPSPVAASEPPKAEVAVSDAPLIPQPPSPIAASEPPKAEVAVPEASVIPQPPTPTAASEPSKPETATPPTPLDSPVPIQVAESVLQAELKESVSEDPKLVTEEAISSMIAPVREIAAAVSETLVEPTVEETKKFDTPDNKIGNGIDASTSPATEEDAKSLEKTIGEAPIAEVAAAAPAPETASSPTEIEATKTAVASAIAETEKSTEPEIKPATDEAVESRETSPEEPSTAISESTKSESSPQPESPSTEGPVRPVRVKESTKTIPGTPTVTEATPPTSPPIGAVQGLESPTKTVKKVTKKVVKKTGSEGEPAEGGDDEASGKKVVKKVVKKTVRKTKDSTDDGGDQNSSTADKPKKVVKVVKKTTTKTTTDSLDVDKSEPETPPAGSSEAPVPPKRKVKTTTTSKTTTATKSDPAP